MTKCKLSAAFSNVGDVARFHRRAQFPGNDVAGEKSSSTVDKSNQPQPMAFKYVKSVCDSWFAAVVFSAR